MYKKAFAALTTLVLTTFSFLTLASPAPFPSQLKGKLFTMEGSNTIGAKLAPNWVKAWLEAKGARNVAIEPQEAENEYRIIGANGSGFVYVDVHAHGSTTGFQGLLAKTADIAMASRSIKSQEVAALASHGNMLSFEAENVVAIDGLAVIVNPANRLKQLSVSQLAKIFAGDILNWSELGGADLPISLYARDENSGTWDTFSSLVLGNNYALAGQAKRFESNDELSDQVAKDTGAIGFVGLASVRSAKPLAVRDDTSRGLTPDIIYVATEDYPLSRRLFIYKPVNHSNLWIDEFLQFTHSEPGQKIVEQIGFVSQNPLQLKVDSLTGPEEYQNLVNHAERLSVNFRFNADDAQLDNKARQDIRRLVSYLKSIDGPVNVQLVGFSKSKNTNQRADVLSKLRASAVRIALFKEGISCEPILGYGADLLVANDNGSSQNKNDRVEVWLFTDEQGFAMGKQAELKKYADN